LHALAHTRGRSCPTPFRPLAPFRQGTLKSP
jgi:hypothetical protein